MILRSLLAWTLGAFALSYTPTAPEILSKMEAALRRTDPVEARVLRERPDGSQETGFRVMIGGGMGWRPWVGEPLYGFVPATKSNC